MYKKLDTNIFLKTWTTKTGKQRSTYYFKIQINGVTIARNAYDPDNPHIAPASLKEARQFRDKIRARLAQGDTAEGGGFGHPLAAPSGAYTFAEFVERFYLPFSEGNHRSHDRYIDYLKVLVKYFGHRPIAEISPFDIERFKLEQSKREKKGGGKLSGNTIRLYLACLSNVFQRAIGERIVGDNPCRHVAPPEVTTRKKRRLSREEESAILDAIKSATRKDRDYLATGMILILELGARPSELWSLRIDDVEWDAAPNDRTVKLTTYKNGRRWKTNAQPKARYIPITDAAWIELLKLKAEAASDLLWPYDKATINNDWHSACKSAGVSGYVFRWLRDEAASRWAEAGLGPFEIALLLGHSDVRTSMVYVKADRARLLEAMSQRSRNVAKQIRRA